MGNGCEWAMNKPSRLPKLVNLFLSPPCSYKVKSLSNPRCCYGQGILALCAVVTAYIFITSRSSSLLPNGLFGAHSPENHCAHILPILPTEFHERQQHLAETLYALNASAYITEPGPSALFYANISTAHWRLSERPLLLVVTPEFHDDRVEARVTVVAPKVRWPFLDRPCHIYGYNITPFVSLRSPARKILLSLLKFSSLIGPKTGAPTRLPLPRFRN